MLDFQKIWSKRYQIRENGLSDFYRTNFRNEMFQFADNFQRNWAKRLSEFHTNVGTSIILLQNLIK